MSDLGEFLELVYDAHNRVRTVEGVFRTRKDQALASTAWHRRAFGNDIDEDDPLSKLPPLEIVSEIHFEWPDKERRKSIEQRTGDEWTISAHPRQAWGIDLFDPAFLLSDYRFEQLQRGAIADRKAVIARVEARPSLWEHSFNHLDLISEVALDAEFGMILRAVWRYEGSEMQRLEFTRISFD